MRQPVLSFALVLFRVAQEQEAFQEFEELGRVVELLVLEAQVDHLEEDACGFRIVVDHVHVAADQGQVGVRLPRCCEEQHDEGRPR